MTYSDAWIQQASPADLSQVGLDQDGADTSGRSPFFPEASKAEPNRPQARRLPGGLATRMLPRGRAGGLSLSRPSRSDLSFALVSRFCGYIAR
jgi:hypothetical protein